ncbi:MerR family transcriptional regulator [Micromonospora endophytica]|uniref:Transcriptional regulator n=1 Tax=Micromonospora endophytica TaxID=515350 RepID=A0A2W2CTS9_9ACTN|nr:MerR family transcriptional regulator [Micromonospora endophytica]PZF91447.1 transcriptional regulator [Micromonospora endophytica]RIW44349.1 MerR family transcriptional regulator [Micromonospora endophytica]
MTPLTPSTRTLGVGDVAVHSGVAPSAVRFYDNHGVIRAVRTSGNQRRFDESAACRIQVAKLAQRAGLTVREIADLFADLSDQPTPEEWGRVAERLVSEVEERVRNLKAQLAAMQSGAKLCEIGRSDPAS